MLVQILNFNLSSEGNISYISPKDVRNCNKPTNPFVFCGSFKESTLNGQSFFTFYGEDEKPWLGFSIWPSRTKEGKLSTWLKIRASWRKVGDMDGYWLNFWTNFCLIVNVRSLEIKVSINGQDSISIISEDLMDKPPKDHRETLVIGKSDHTSTSYPIGPRQFVGSVTNIFFDASDSDLDIKVISGNLCGFEGNDWKPSQWMTYGHVTETTEEEIDVCNKNGTYRIPLAFTMSWIEGIQLCKKLGSGRMTEVKDQKDLEYTVRQFSTSQCKYVWAPITDEENEGLFKSAISGEYNRFLPWDNYHPNGEDYANFVAIVTSSGRYRDLALTPGQCVSCDLGITTQFYLTGLCEDTFLDSVYVLNNNHGNLEYEGMHTVIRYLIISFIFRLFRT